MGCGKVIQRDNAQLLEIHQEDNWAGIDPHRSEIGRIFHNKYMMKMLSGLKAGKCWTRLASYPLQYGN